MSVCKVTEIAAPQFHNIPTELTEQDLWVNFSSEWDSAKNKWTKPPCNQYGQLIKGGFKETRPYESAKQIQETNPKCVKGVGFSFAAEKTDIIGLDFDHVVLSDGSLLPAVESILEALNTYTEISISGDGLHAFVSAPKFDMGGKGKLKFEGAFGPGTGLEIFKSTGYMTVSGNRVDRFGTTVRNKVATKINKLINTYRKQRAAKTKANIENAGGDERFATAERFVTHFEEVTGIRIVGQVPKDEGTIMLKLERCPWGGGMNPVEGTHDDGPDDAVIFFRERSVPVFHCFHTTCGSHKWKELCALFPELARGDFIDEFNAEFAIVSHGTDIVVARLDPGASTRATTAKAPRSFFLEQSYRFDEYEDAQGLTKRIQKADAWFSSPAAKRYKNGFVLKPNRDELPGELNIWKGFATEPSADGCWDKFRSHWLNEVCGGNQEYFKWMQMWFAEILQHPGNAPLGTAIILKGEQGFGKSLVGEMFARVIGDDYSVNVSTMRDLSGQFNSHVVTSVLVNGDEITFHGDKVSHNALKGVITARKRSLEHKRQDVIKIANISRYFITTNADIAIPAERTERRFLVLRVGSFKTEAEMKQRFDPMWDQMENENGYARLLYDMLKVKVIPGELRRAPKTTELLNEKRESLSGVMRFLDDLFHDGNLPEEKDDGYDGTSGWPEVTSVGTLYTRYIDCMRVSGCRQSNVRSKISFSRELQRILSEAGIMLERITKSHQDQRRGIEDLETAQTKWESYLRFDT